MSRVFKILSFLKKSSKAEDVDNIDVQNVMIKTNKIRILDPFYSNKPSTRKLSDKENYYLTNGKFKENIVINKYNILVDGYTTYLLAIKYNIKKIKVIKNMKY